MKKISIKGVFLINIQIRFGPSGNDNLFYKQGYRSSIDMPKWLYEMGLNAYEYSLTRGIHIEEHTAKEIGEQAAKWGISMSVHAPYYINLASQKEENRLKSIQYIVRSAEVALWIGANRVVFHPGSSGKDRESALKLLKNTIACIGRVWGIYCQRYSIMSRNYGKKKSIRQFGRSTGIMPA